MSSKAPLLDSFCEPDIEKGTVPVNYININIATKRKRGKKGGRRAGVSKMEFYIFS